MAILKNLVKEGKSIILITHKLDEIRKQFLTTLQLSVVGNQLKLSRLEATNADLAEMMVGRSVFFKTEANLPTKEVVLSIKDLVVNENPRCPSCEKSSLDVRAGEIVGMRD